jgi:hypothetical protein
MYFLPKEIWTIILLLDNKSLVNLVHVCKLFRTIIFEFFSNNDNLIKKNINIYFFKILYENQLIQKKYFDQCINYLQNYSNDSSKKYLLLSIPFFEKKFSNIGNLNSKEYIKILEWIKRDYINSCNIQ